MGLGRDHAVIGTTLQIVGETLCEPLMSRLFDGPARAISGAVAIRDAVRQLGLEMRAGLHTGEVELRGEDISGIAVHLAERVQALAQPGEVLVMARV